MRIRDLRLLAMVSVAFTATPALAASKCTPDSVKVGSFCMDSYEASVWRIPDPFGVNKGLVKKIQKGKAEVDDLIAGGASQLGASGDNYAPCDDRGQSCVNDIFAVSVAGVTPSAYITWFQAQQACSNSGKRLPSNGEWQQAVAGTPDGAPCNVSSASVSATGAAGCVSSYGVNDMVGNLYEWVADWVPRSTACGAWSGSTDDQCLGGAATSGEPGALVRGGFFSDGSGGGPLAVDGSLGPSFSDNVVGFRCAR